MHSIHLSFETCSDLHTHDPLLHGQPSVSALPPAWNILTIVPCVLTVCLFIYLLTYLLTYLLIFWLRWVFIAARRLSLVAASGGYSLLWCAVFSLWWLLLLWSTSSKRGGSVVVAHGLSCSAACGIFLDQGSNLCPLHWQADS